MTQEFISTFFSSLFKRNQISSFKVKPDSIDVYLYQYRNPKFTEGVKNRINKTFKNSNYKINFK